jgi:RNA polymerase sigma-70 factor (ECF subfamily)
MAHYPVAALAESPVENRSVPVFYPAMGKGSNPVTDEELVERSLKGEEDAFRNLYERYRHPVYSAVYRIVLDHEEAQDATQEAFFAVYRSLSVWNPQRAGFLPWAYRVATNRAIDYWRVKQRRAEVPFDETSDTESNGLSHQQKTVETMEHSMEKKDRIAELRQFMETLPQPHRRFMVLRYCDGLKLKEIAEKEGCKIGTVKSVIHRATHTLRLKLRRLYKQLNAY